MKMRKKIFRIHRERSSYYGSAERLGKVVLTASLLLLAATTARANSKDLTVLLDRPPANLDPRLSYDAPSQRLGELIYRGLTRMDKDLSPQPDLAESWQVLEGGKLWRFKIRKGAQDHSGKAIDATRMAACLESYRAGKPVSPLIGSFPNWIATEKQGDEISVRFSKPDPYFAQNATLLRYFTTGNPDQPCRSPKDGETIVTSGMYRPERFTQDDLSAPYEIRLLPFSDPNGRPLHFVFVMDENTRFLKIIRGEVDAAPSSLGLAKTREIQNRFKNGFKVLERDNVSVSYLAFNLREAPLSDVRVRRAIAMAIDREDYIAHKMMGFGTIAKSLIFPTLPESYGYLSTYDPAAAEKLLEDAGYRRGADGVRLRLRYKTTPVRDGLEMARIFQSMLSKIGVQLTIDVVEPAVFLASVRKGAFQLYSSRWIGIADGSILYRTLRSGNPDNRSGYKNPEVDRLLDLAIAEPDLEKRKTLLRQVQIDAGDDVPVFPLWYWGGAVVLKNTVTGLESAELSLSGSLVPLSKLR